MTTLFRESLNAILFACGGWFLFCVCDVIAKYLSGSYGAFEILAVMGVWGTLLSALWIGIQHGWAGFKTPQWHWYLFRSLSQAAATFLVIKSLFLIPLADFYGIIFMAPLIITLLAALFLKETIGAYRIAAIALGFVGIVIIAGPSFSSGNIGYLYAFLSVIFTSMSAIFVRKIGRETIPARYAFFPFLICALIFVPLTLSTGFTPNFEPLNIGLLLLFAPISLLALLGYSIGFSRARDTALVAPFHYTQMIWGTAFGFLIFGDIPGLTTFVGSLLIIFAGFLIIWREHVLHRENAIAAINSPL